MRLKNKKREETKNKKTKMVTELPLWASVGFTSNNASKRIIESFFPASAKRSCQHIKNETAQVKGKLGGGGE